MTRREIIRAIQKTIKKANESKSLFAKGCYWHKYSELKALLVREQNTQWRR